MTMLTIAISRDLAKEHSAFTSEMVERGHRVDVFTGCESAEETPGTRTLERSEPGEELERWAHIGAAHPTLGFYAACAGSWDEDPCGCPICQSAEFQHANASAAGELFFAECSGRWDRDSYGWPVCQNASARYADEVPQMEQQPHRDAGRREQR